MKKMGNKTRRTVKIVRGWNPDDGPKPYSGEWWERRDARNALRRAVESTKRAR